jgi:hypothetical protein
LRRDITPSEISAPLTATRRYPRRSRSALMIHRICKDATARPLRPQSVRAGHSSIATTEIYPRLRRSPAADAGARRCARCARHGLGGARRSDKPARPPSTSSRASRQCCSRGADSASAERKHFSSTARTEPIHSLSAVPRDQDCLIFICCIDFGCGPATFDHPIPLFGRIAGFAAVLRQSPAACAATHQLKRHETSSWTAPWR